MFWELGASFNAFSLELSDSFDQSKRPMRKLTNQEEATNPELTNADFLNRLELIGQSSDSEVIHLHSLIRHHELLRDRLQEIILYCGSIQRSSEFILKRANLEDFHDQINARKNALMQMESTVKKWVKGNLKIDKA